MSKKTLQVTYVKSSVGYALDQRRTVVALGLKYLGDVVEVPDNSAMRGMLHKVSHLIVFQEKEE